MIMVSHFGFPVLVTHEKEPARARNRTEAQAVFVMNVGYLPVGWLLLQYARVEGFPTDLQINIAVQRTATEPRVIKLRPLWLLPH